MKEYMRVGFCRTDGTCPGHTEVWQGRKFVGLLPTTACPHNGCGVGGDEAVRLVRRRVEDALRKVRKGERKEEGK